jgi:hypothetical protein
MRSSTKKGKENVVVDALSRKYEEDRFPFSPIFHCCGLSSGGSPEMVTRSQNFKIDPNTTIGSTSLSKILVAP